MTTHPRSCRLSRLVAATLLVTGAALQPACKARQEAGSSAVMAFPTTSSRSALFDYPTAEDMRAYVSREFERAKVSTSASILSLNYTDLARLTGAYGLTIRRYGDGAQQREDRWRLSSDIMPGAVLQDAAASALPIAPPSQQVAISPTSASSPTRRRRSPRAKMPHELPFDAARARAMEPGDFASLPVYMGLALGLEAGTSVPPFAVSAGTGVFWNGEFRFNVFRLDGDRVRLKVAPSDTRGWQVGAGASPASDMFGYGPFGLVNLDRQAERLLGSTSSGSRPRACREARRWRSTTSSTSATPTRSSPSTRSCRRRCGSKPRRLGLKQCADASTRTRSSRT